VYFCCQAQRERVSWIYSTAVLGGDMKLISPVIGSCFTSDQGESFEVIGRGTGGVVVEYADGRAELIDLQTWQTLDINPELEQQQA
jgi:hypothetical protein